MAKDIILDDWAYPEPFDFLKNVNGSRKIDMTELQESIQKNRETVRRMRNNTKYADVLQKV